MFLIMISKVCVCVCVLQVSPCACSADDERCCSSCLLRLGVVWVFFISSCRIASGHSGKPVFAVFVSQRGSVSVTPTDSSSACICVEICMCPWSQLPHPPLLLRPLLQVLPEPDVLGPWASWSSRKAVDCWPFSKNSPDAHCHI